MALKDLKADIAVIGEGEITTYEIARCLIDKGSTGKIDGIAYLDRDTPVFTPRRELIKDINILPPVDYEMFNLKEYLKYGFQVLSSRGCPYRCKFCYRIFGSAIRFRDLTGIVNEIESYKNKYNFTYVWLIDELTFVIKDRILKFCDLIEERSLNIKWAFAMRINQADEYVLKRALECGCVRLYIGFESGSQKMLDRINKKITVKQMEEGISRIYRAGFENQMIDGSIMIGNPGENPDTIRETIDFIKRNNLFVYSTHIVTPYPGSQLYDEMFTSGKYDRSDEKEIVLKLADTSTFELAINLTDYSDEEVLSWAEKMNSENRYNFLKFRLSKIINKYNNPIKIVVYGAAVTGKSTIDILLESGKSDLKLIDTYLGGQGLSYKNYEIQKPETDIFEQSDIILIATPDYFIYRDIKQYIIKKANIKKEKITGCYQGKINNFKGGTDDRT